MTELRTDVPPTLATLVARCLEKDPAKRPQTGRELLQSLDVDASSDLAHFQRRRAVRLLLIASPIVAVAALVVLLKRDGTDPVTPVRSQQLAVVPFANVGGDTTQDFRADGLTDALYIEVKKLPALSLVARTATNRFRGQRSIDARVVGQELKVAYVLHGTFRSDGTTQRVFARLSRTSDGEDVWQDEFDHAVSDVFAAEDDIRDSVVAALQKHVEGLASAPAPTVSSRGTTDTAAYNLYQLGQFFLGRRGRGVALAAEHFQAAINRDAGFARAHAGLAAALEILPNFSDTTFVDVHDRATAAARHALQLDSTLSEAHMALALAQMHSFEWARADSQFRTALRHDPRDPAAHMQYGRLMVYTGRLQEALAEFQHAKELDPASALISSWLATSLMTNGRQQEAFAEIDRALEIDSMNPPIIFFGSIVNHRRGRIDVAQAVVARHHRSTSGRAPRRRATQLLEIVTRLSDCCARLKPAAPVHSGTPRSPASCSTGRHCPRAG